MRPERASTDRGAFQPGARLRTLGRHIPQPGRLSRRRRALTGKDAEDRELRCLTFYAGPPRGGCYQRLVRLERALLARGWTVHHIGSVPPDVRHPGLCFHGLSHNPLSLRVLAGGVWQAARVTIRERVELLLSFGAVYSVLLGPLRLLPGRRLVTFLRGSFVEQERAAGAGAWRVVLARAIEWMAVRASDAVVAVSEDLARRVGGRPAILPNDVAIANTPDRSWSRAQLGLPQDAFLVGYAGAVRPIKSLETLLHAVARIPSVRLALMGLSQTETAYESRIRTLMSELGLAERAHFLAWSTDTRRFLAAVDVVVLPSSHEGCPNLLLEAMALGTPCLGARSGGIEEVLEVDALLFPQGDSEALAERLERLRVDPSERERLAALGRQRAAAFVFDWEARAVGFVEQVLR